jgi:U3 small nucleolar RNA-associated protein 12
MSMKSYLRYEPKKSFGVIASPQCNVTYDCSGNLAITGALQEICIWNIRQASQIGSLKVSEVNYPYSTSGDATLLVRGNDKTTVAAGFSGGELRIFNYINKECVATFRGHRSAVSSIAYEKNGSIVASGSNDTDIFLWDLVTLTGTTNYRNVLSMELCSDFRYNTLFSLII